MSLLLKKKSKRFLQFDLSCALFFIIDIYRNIKQNYL